jgi:redox-sensitive bicupin YhaK (pirin superfamily)
MITEGGIQWMTAGWGLVHSEVSSAEFKKKGGVSEIIQIWLNLPSGLKNTEPQYTGLEKDRIPSLSLDDSRVVIHVISGSWGNVEGPVESLTGIQMTRIEFKRGGRIKTNVEQDRNILLYVVNGKIRVNNESAGEHILVEFDNDSKEVVMEALEDSEVIFGHGKPYNEPIVAQGPFVMNNVAEIKQAIYDYQSGKMGTWTGS